MDGGAGGDAAPISVSGGVDTRGQSDQYNKNYGKEQKKEKGELDFDEMAEMAELANVENFENYGNIDFNFIREGPNRCRYTLQQIEDLGDDPYKDGIPEPQDLGSKIVEKLFSGFTITSFLLRVQVFHCMYAMYMISSFLIIFINIPVTWKEVMLTHPKPWWFAIWYCMMFGPIGHSISSYARICIGREGQKVPVYVDHFLFGMLPSCVWIFLWRFGPEYPGPDKREAMSQYGMGTITFMFFFWVQIAKKKYLVSKAGMKRTFI